MTLPYQNWRWTFADAELAAQLPELFSQLEQTLPFKENPVRRVWSLADNFVKIDFRSARPLVSEYRHARQLEKAGLPVVHARACAAGNGIGVLITKTETASRCLQEYLLDAIPDAALLESFRAFVTISRQRGLVHHDLHSGNLLYRSDLHQLVLVDVRDAWLLPRCFASGRGVYLHLAMELRRYLPRERMYELIRGLGYRHPEAVFRKKLRRLSAIALKMWPKRRCQVRAGYPKYSCKKGELLCSSDCPLPPEACEVATGSYEDLEAHVFLTLAHIPHRAVSGATAHQVYRVPLPDGATPPPPELLADYQERLQFLGIVSNAADWRYCDGKIMLTDLSGTIQRLRELN